VRKFIAMLAIATLFSLLAITLQGCGGGGDGGGGSSSPSERPVKTTLNWSARSKVIYAPGSAQSVKFTLLSHQDNSAVGAVIFNRKPEPAEYAETVTSSNTIRFTDNSFLAKVDFYTDKDARGAVVATAQQNVSLASDGTLLGTNGQSASFTVNKRVAFLEIPAGQTIPVGDTTNLRFLARASDYTTIALSDGSVFFKLVSGATALSLEPNGLATGKATGAATIQASADGIESENAQVNVNLGVATVEVPAGQSVGVGENKTLTVIAKKANGGVVDIPAGGVSVVATEGKEHVTLSSNGAISGLGIGTTKVTATVSGVTSAVSDVTITIGPEIKSSTGLKYREMKLTNGTPAANGKTATVKYRGTLTDGTEFDAGTFDFKLGAGQVVKGFDEGVVSMKVGGQRLLTIPPDLAYGENPPTDKIPVNATLVFDVTLIAIK